MLVTSKVRNKTDQTDALKSLPIGISDFAQIQSHYYYVDKTLLIKEFLDRKTMVTLFTRPYGFGKTLNMDMLRVFFEKSKTDTSKYFADTNIWKCGETYKSHQGKYPVIFLTFKDVNYDSWQATLSKIRELLQAEFRRHHVILDSGQIAKYEKDYFSRILAGTSNEVDLTSALEKLSQMLRNHYNIAPIIIIDEYDTPIQTGYSNGFYDEMIVFMRNFFSGTFKDNRNLCFGFLTGIFNFTQASIFNGFNNLNINSVIDRDYDKFFGFTCHEVLDMLEYYGIADKEDEIKTWYNGYRFGDEEIYNPWSVINYISHNCIPQTYWRNTGKNKVLEYVLNVVTDDIGERLHALLQGECVISRIDLNSVYRDYSKNSCNIYSLLLAAGYLSISKKVLQPDGSYLCEVSIPNEEITTAYKKEIL